MNGTNADGSKGIECSIDSVGVNSPSDIALGRKDSDGGFAVGGSGLGNGQSASILGLIIRAFIYINLVDG